MESRRLFWMRIVVVGAGIVAASSGLSYHWATIAYGRWNTFLFPSLRGLDGVGRFPEAETDNFVAYLRSWQSAQ